MIKNKQARINCIKYRARRSLVLITPQLLSKMSAQLFQLELKEELYAKK